MYLSKIRVLAHLHEEDASISLSEEKGVGAGLTVPKCGLLKSESSILGMLLFGVEYHVGQLEKTGLSCCEGVSHSNVNRHFVSLLSQEIRI